MLVSGKQQFLCWQLPNAMFLYIILHMAINFQGTNVNVLLLATIAEAAQANEKWWGKYLLVGCSHQDFNGKIFATSRHCTFT